MGSVVISEPPADLARYSHHMGGAGEPGPDRQPSAPAPSSRSSGAVPSNQTSAPPSRNPSSASAASVPPNAARPPGPSSRQPSSSSESRAGRGELRGPRPSDSTSYTVTATASSASRDESSASGSASSADMAMQAEQHDADFDRAGFPQQAAPRGLTAPPSPQLLPTIRSSLSFVKSRDASPSRTTKIQSLKQIHSFVHDDASAAQQSRPGGAGGVGGPGAGAGAGGRAAAIRSDDSQQFEISEMPVTEIIEMVAGLLTKITTTNDRQRQQSEGGTDGHGSGAGPATRTISSPIEGVAAAANPSPSSALGRQTASVLAFHGKNVPSISILSYLSRIHKYCPTTYEVFLSLLVYFDRMTEQVNRHTLSSFRSAARCAHRDVLAPGAGPAAGSNSMANPLKEAQQQRPTQHQTGEQVATGMATPPPSGAATASQNRPDDNPPSGATRATDEGGGEESGKFGHYFVVDSFNIHRLVIAGVTCASKFFSDVFYTNSRYAKVGGLPIHELNHLELQFLLLNDFRLCVPVEELEAYGSRLVKFYLEEVAAQQVTGAGGSPPDDLYMRSPAPDQQQ